MLTFCWTSFSINLSILYICVTIFLRIFKKNIYCDTKIKHFSSIHSIFACGSTQTIDLRIMTHVFWRHDTQHNDIQHNDIQHNDTQHHGCICDTQHNWHLAYMTRSINTLQHYAKCRMLSVMLYLLLCWMSLCWVALSLMSWRLCYQCTM